MLSRLWKGQWKGRCMRKIGVGAHGPTANATGSQNLASLIELAGRLGGWVTTDLASRWVWPTPWGAEEVTRRKKAEALIRRAVSTNLLLPRPLGGRRHAYVLTRSGAERARTRLSLGTGWGRMVDGEWSPPRDFEHAERGARFIVWMTARNGYLTRTEHQIAKANPRASKLPDGLISPDGQEWIWLEVENARKSGAEMRHMAKELIDIELGHGRSLALGEGVQGRVQPRRAMIVLPPDTHQDDRGYLLSHQQRIENAVHNQCPAAPVALEFFIEHQPWVWDREATLISTDD